MPTKPKKTPGLTPIPKPRAPGKALAGRVVNPVGHAQGERGEGEGERADLAHIAPQLHALAVRTGDLEFLADNPMDHDEESVETMRDILRKRGQLQPLIVNRRPKPAVVVGGNKRLKAALLENWEWIAVLDVDLSPEDEAALAIEMNASQDQTWHKEHLKASLERIGTLNLGERRDALLAKLADAQKLLPNRGDDEQPQPPAPPAHKVVVLCRDEAQQTELFERLRGEGFECKAIKAGA